MATINDFKREISELVKAQKVAKRINHQSEVYRNRGLLHAMYVAYYILKHKLVGGCTRSLLQASIRFLEEIKIQRLVWLLRWRLFKGNMEILCE